MRRILTVVAVVAFLGSQAIAGTFSSLTFSPQDMSADGSLVGGGNSLFSGVTLSETNTGAPVVGVENVGGVATAAGNFGGSAAVYQNGVWTPVGSFTATGFGAGSGDYWVSGKSGTNVMLYAQSTGTTATIPSGLSSLKTVKVSNNGLLAGAGNNGNSEQAFVSNGTGGVKLVASTIGTGFQVQTEAFAISSDGTQAAGWGWGLNGAWPAMRWDVTAGTPHDIPPNYSGNDWDEAWAVNGDGTVFGGFEYTASSGWTEHKAWITNLTTRTWVSNYLAAEGVDVTGWAFTNVTGMSDDGLSFCGTGTYNGVATGWAYTVPEPASLVLLSLGGLFLRRRR